MRSRLSIISRLKMEIQFTNCSDLYSKYFITLEKEFLKLSSDFGQNTMRKVLNDVGSDLGKDNFICIAIDNEKIIAGAKVKILSDSLYRICGVYSSKPNLLFLIMKKIFEEMEQRNYYDVLGIVPDKQRKRFDQIMANKLTQIGFKTRVILKKEKYEKN